MTAPKTIWAIPPLGGDWKRGLGMWDASEFETLTQKAYTRADLADTAAAKQQEADLISTWNAAIRAAADAATYVIQNIDILKADGETYETPRVQKVARGLVDVARQDILTLLKPEGGE